MEVGGGETKVGGLNGVKEDDRMRKEGEEERQEEQECFSSERSKECCLSC